MWFERVNSLNVWPLFEIGFKEKIVFYLKADENKKNQISGLTCD